MRRIREAVLPFTGNNDDRLPKTVREYREKYKGVSRILDDHPEILELAHEDLKRLSSGGCQGAGGGFHLGDDPAGLGGPRHRGPFAAGDRGADRRERVPPGLPADAEEGGDGLHVFWTSASRRSGRPPGNTSTRHWRRRR